MKTTIFTLTEDHLKLLKNMYVEWNDDAYEGSPMVGIKRPYGNSDVIEDVAEIVAGRRDGGEVFYTRDSEDELIGVYGEDTRVFTVKELNALHRQMDTALQIVLCTQSFVAGTYHKREQFSARSWVLVPEEKVGLL